MGDAPDFLTNFYNLQGDSPGERKKNLFKLFIKHKSDKQMSEVLQKIKPRNYQESLFRIEALLYFEQTGELLEILKAGNNVLASKILKNSRFIEEAFKDIQANTLVNDFFPYLSYVIRKKLLNRLSRCSGQAKIDDLFTALYNIYGLSAASEILHKCSSGKIKLVLEENEVKLRPNQVIQLFNNSKEVFNIYLEHLNQVTKSQYNEDKVLDYVAIKDPKLLLEIVKTEKVFVHKLGRRTTKNIIKTSKEEIAIDVKRYVKFLNRAALVRHFAPNFEIIYKQIFPTKFSELSWNSCNLIENYSKNKRWELFFRIFSEKFTKKSLTDIFLSFDQNIKKFQPPQDIMYQWAEFFYEKKENNNYEDYIKYYPVSRAISIIQQKINVTSDGSRRNDLLKLLVMVCIENNDVEALEDVLKYISARHRNEENGFRHILMWNVNRMPMESISENLWRYLYEQMEILKVQDDYFHNNEFLLYKYLEFLFKNKKDHTKILTVYLNHWKDDSFYHNAELKNPEIEKEMYLGMIKIFQDIFKPESESYQQSLNAFVDRVISFCLKNKEYCINLSDIPYFVSQIIKSIEDFDSDMEYKGQILIYNETFPQYAVPVENSKIVTKILHQTKKFKGMWWFIDAFDKLVCRKCRSTLGQELLKAYMEELFVDYPRGEVAQWFLKHDPKAIEPYFEIILKGSLQNLGKSYNNPLDCKLLRQYPHLEFDRKARDFFMKHLDSKNNSDRTKALVESLGILVPTDDYIKIVEPFLPKKYQLDLEDEEMREEYRVQCEVAKILAKVLEPYKMLPTIMKFAKGDYLQSALPPLYGAFYNSPQRILYSYVEQLANQAVSVRKHAIFLSCAVLDKEHAINLIKSTNHANVSSQKHLFSATLKYFLKNPSEDLLDKVIESMNTIDKNDTETLESLWSVSIPTKYRPLYIEKCWKFFENLGSSGVNINGYLEKLLVFMCGDILTNLSTDFVAYILEKYFTKSVCGINEFTVQVLKKRKSEQIGNFEKVYKFLEKFDRKHLQGFFQSFLSAARNDMDDKDFIKLFSDHWNKNHNITETLEEHIVLKLLVLRVDNRDIESYAHSVVDYMKKLISELSFLVNSAFKDQLAEAIGSFDLETKLQFHLAMLKYDKDPSTCVLVIQLLEAIDDDESEEIETMHNEITSILKNVDVPIVRAYCKSYCVC